MSIYTMNRFPNRCDRCRIALSWASGKSPKGTDEYLCADCFCEYERTRGMNDKSKKALAVIEQHFDDLDEIGQTLVIKRIISEWGALLSSIMFRDHEEDN